MKQCSKERGGWDEAYLLLRHTQPFYGALKKGKHFFWLTVPWPFLATDCRLSRLNSVEGKKMTEILHRIAYLRWLKFTEVWKNILWSFKWLLGSLLRILFKEDSVYKPRVVFVVIHETLKKNCYCNFKFHE